MDVPRRRRSRRLVYGVLALQHPRVAALPGRRRATVDEAREVLRQVDGRAATPTRASREIQRVDEPATEHSRTWRDLRGPRLGLLPIVWIGIVLSVFQQFVGINVIFYYSSMLWQAVGFSEDDSLLITVDHARRQHRRPRSSRSR